MKNFKFILLSALVAVSGSVLSSCTNDNKSNTLSVTPTSHTFEAEGNERQEFQVRTNASWWAASADDITESWLKIEEIENSFFVTIEDWDGDDFSATEQRHAVITVTAEDADPVKINIYQKLPQTDLRLAETTMNFTAFNDLTKQVQVITEIPDDDITVKVTEGSWITHYEMRLGYLVVTVAENPDEQQRTGKIELSSAAAEGKAVLTVIQEAAPTLESVLVGDWKMTGTDLDGNAVNTTVTISAAPALGGYLMGPFSQYVEELDETVSGSVLLNVDMDTEQVSFVYGTDLKQTYVYEMDPISYTYYMVNDIFLTGPREPILDEGYTIDFEVSNDKNTIVAPSTITFDYGTWGEAEYDVYVGLGMTPDLAEIGEDHIQQQILVVKGLTLTRLEE